MTSLMKGAARQHDPRYARVAELNALGIQYDDGAAGAVEALRQARARKQDWYAQVLADALWARVLIDRRDAGAALRLLSASERNIPVGQPESSSAEAVVWEMIGLSLMSLNDLDASAAAFQRSQFEFADPAIRGRTSTPCTILAGWPSSWDRSRRPEGWWKRTTS